VLAGGVDPSNLLIPAPDGTLLAAFKTCTDAQHGRRTAARALICQTSVNSPAQSE
jgi:hypothetical protein